MKAHYLRIYYTENKMLNFEKRFIAWSGLWLASWGFNSSSTEFYIRAVRDDLGCPDLGFCSVEPVFQIFEWEKV